MRFVTPEEFASYAAIGAAKGFLLVSASPLTRSSHHAGDDFARLKAARLPAERGRADTARLLTLNGRGCRHSAPSTRGERVAQ